MTLPIYTALLQMYAAVIVSGIDYICPYTTQKCVCEVDSIHCAGKELTELPPIRAVNFPKPLSLFIYDNSLTNIPAGGLPSKLSSIDFQRNPITTIDQDAFNGSADTLTELLFSTALFTELPSAFLRLRNLTQLIITETKIKTWNVDIVKHIGATLQTLLLIDVGITVWPTWIQYLVHLGSLNLSGASILVPDDGFDNQMNTLFSLILENGILTQVPSSVSKLTKLEKLDLDNNNISRVTGIPQSAVLSTISMNGNKISDAAQLSNFLRSVAGSLKDLQLSNNLLTQLPDLSTMIKLDSVYLTSNPISYIGDSKIPSSLTTLHMELNNLQSLDSFMRDGFNLTEVSLRNNSVNEIRGIDIPVNVLNMDISNNLLSKLTDYSFPQNSNMQTLNLNYNPITDVSSLAFAGLTKLKSLFMSSTKITRLPLSFTHLKSAESVDVSGNDRLICTCLEKDVLAWSQLRHVVIEGQCGVTSIYNFLFVLSDQCPD